MGLFYSNKPGPGIDKDAPPAKGLRLFFQTLAREFFSLIKVNFLFYLFCIPIITIPASYCAMTRISVNMVRDKPYFLWDDFWKTFRAEFAKSTIAGIAIAAGLTAAIVSARYYGNLAESSAIFWILFCLATFGAFLLLFTSFSLFPIISIVDLPLRKAAKNAFILISVSFFRYILALIICAALLLLGVMLFPYSILPAFLIYPSFLNLITVFSAYGGIKKYILQEQTEASVPTQPD